jgi:4-hydroxy 2-oxovalerate aldolase
MTTTRDVSIVDSTLRDGSHAMSHGFTEQHVRATVRALDFAGVPVIEVTHGDGLSGSSFNYGFSATPELRLVATAVDEAKRAKIAVLLLPGVGTVDDLRRAADAGASVVRIATHCTEADVSIQHFGFARELGLDTMGFLMMSHMIGPEALAKQARIMADAGAECVYVVDSAGALIMRDTSDRVEALRAELGTDAEVGFHGHQNLSLGIANSLLAFESGAQWIDGCTCGLGAGAGNSPTEILVTTFRRLGVETGIDVAAILVAAEEVVRPYMLRQPVTDRSSIVLGYAGVYSSFLLHAQRAAERYHVGAHDILTEAGRRHYVGGQEDMLIEIAAGLAAEQIQASATGADRY